VWYAATAGLVCGLGNYLLGVHLAKAGIMGASLTGPLNLVILVGYRLCQAIGNKRRLGTYIDYKDSNWWTANKQFRRYHLKALAGNSLPCLAGLVLLSCSFKYASLGGLNQGIIPTLNSLAGVYCAILFYFKFNEIISVAQLIGMVCMVASVVLFGYEGAAAKVAAPLPVGAEKQLDLAPAAALMPLGAKARLAYALLALVLGALCPLFYTSKAYTCR
jgi:hypothetical protein